MVDSSKYNQALQALHGILVLLRSCALKEEDTKKIATVLDITEELPRFLATEKDQTRDFEEVLRDLADRFPEFGIGLSLFHQDSAPLIW